jgi:hypothetical protein
MDKLGGKHYLSGPEPQGWVPEETEQSHPPA